MKNLFGEQVAADELLEKSSDVVSDEHDQTVSRSSSFAFNIFALTDAIGARKKREAWMLYQKALASGMSAEEIFYKIFWQVKTMLLSSKTKNATEADMKDFPYNKAKSFLKNFKEGELEKISQNLVKNYHEIRRGNGKMETFIEKFVLSL